MALSVEAQLASWEIAGSPGQVRLGEFLDHVQAAAAPIPAAVDGQLAVEPNVELRDEPPLTGRGAGIRITTSSRSRSGWPSTDSGHVRPEGSRTIPFRLLATLNRTTSRHPRSSPLRSPVPMSAQNRRRRSGVQARRLAGLLRPTQEQHKFGSGRGPTREQLSALEKTCQGRSFAQRRDAAIIAVRTATGIRAAELAGIRYDPHDPRRSDLDLWRREITVRGKGGRPRIVKIGHEAARALDRYLRARSRHAQAHRPQLWLGVNNRGPMTANGIYQMIARRGRQCGVDAWTHRFRRHFSHTWLDRGGAEGDLMELTGWSSPQMLRRYGASARSARARRTYDRIMEHSP